MAGRARWQVQREGGRGRVTFRADERDDRDNNTGDVWPLSLTVCEEGVESCVMDDGV